VLAPLPVAPVNEADMVLLPKGLQALKQVAKQVAVELIARVLACLAEGLGIRATARVFEVDPNTVLHWLVEAAEQLRAFARDVLCEVHVRQVQLDEL
jgi:hypothetical protein